MKFNEVLNKYLEELDCTAKKLSIESGLTGSVISRYRSGERNQIGIIKVIALEKRNRCLGRFQIIGSVYHFHLLSRIMNFDILTDHYVRA